MLREAYISRYFCEMFVRMLADHFDQNNSNTIDQANHMTYQFVTFKRNRTKVRNWLKNNLVLIQSATGQVKVIVTLY